MLLWIALQPIAAACDSESVEVVAISPEEGAHGVPVDTSVVLHALGVGDLDTNTMVLWGQDGAVPGEWSFERTAVSHGSVWTFTPTRLLTPNQHYVLDIAADEHPDSAYSTSGWGVSFTTGETLSPALEGRPELTLESVGQVTEGYGARCEPEGFRRVSYQFSPIDVDRPAEYWVHLSMLEESGEVLLDARRLDARDWVSGADVLVPSTERSFCLVGSVRGPGGEEVASEPACFEAAPLPEEQAIAYYGGNACSAVGAQPLSMGLWVLAVMFRRRCA